MFSVSRFFLSFIVSLTVVHAFVISHNKWQSSRQEPRIERGIRSVISTFELKSSLSSELSPPLHSEVIAAGNSSAFLDFDGEAFFITSCIGKISRYILTAFMWMISIITFLTEYLLSRYQWFLRRFHHFYKQYRRPFLCSSLMTASRLTPVTV
jgi:hypothetical protein